MIPIKKNTVDIILSFYSLEHLYNLDKNLVNYKKILKQNGIIVGALPCEGGFLYGIGRFFTSRRFIHKKKLLIMIRLSVGSTQILLMKCFINSIKTN